ncbi:G-protein alpha subunit [Plasmodiophora brassicae]|uniref:Uncharacterized protein n=1 Tax=Plasmodiophora brassicae TaxID=37360 RepID=A0A3P3YPG9_PLABS|nr:unnamed protein product [Plasmodiophora brassicae]
MACCPVTSRRVKPEGHNDDGNVSIQINRALEHDRERAACAPVALFLGIGDSGKTTFCKQLRILHGVPYPREELVLIKQSIHNLIVHDVGKLVSASSNADVMEKILKKFATDISVEFPAHVNDARAKVRKWASSGTLPPVVDEGIADIVMTLWSDPTMRMVYAECTHGEELQLGPQAEYFFDKIGSICSASWLPNEDDIVRWRVKTIGVWDQKIACVIDGVASEIRIVDVGGQRSERRKWMHQFSAASIIMYVASLSDYNQLCPEDGKTTRLLEALRVFQEVCSSPALSNVGIVVFFNKCDLFKDKLRIAPFKDHVAGYEGDGSYDSACGYMEALYRQTAMRAFHTSRSPSSRVVNFFFTTAVDKKNVQHVFYSVRDIIVRSQLNSDGLI